MSNILQIIFGIIGSISLFIWSVIAFEKNIKEIAGEKFKHLLGNLTSNKFKGLILGTATTGIIQSSSATTVLTAGIVGAGLLPFYNSLGIIFGANIGTSITSQLIAFDVMSVSPFIILLGIAISFWGNSFKKFGKPIALFGILFLSIHLISIFVTKIDPQIIAPLLKNITNIYFAILIGIIATIIFQSSSVVSGIILIFASAGHLALPESVGLILGANIGTTSTVIIASFAMQKEAKKVALAHFLFNFIGVIVIIPFLPIFYSSVKYLDGDILHQIANIHLMFNIFCAFIFIIFTKPFAKFINYLIK